MPAPLFNHAIVATLLTICFSGVAADDYWSLVVGEDTVSYETVAALRKFLGAVVPVE